MTVKDSVSASRTSAGAAEFLAADLEGQVVAECRVAVGRLPPCIEQLRQRQAFALEEGFAAFEFFQVEDGERLHGAVRPVPFGGELFVDVADGQRVDGELAADDDDREDPAGRGGQRGGRGLGVAQQVRRGLVQLPGFRRSRSFPRPARNEPTSASSRVGTFTVPETTSASTTSPPKSIPASQFLVPGNAVCRCSSVKNARPPPISAGAIRRSWSSARVSIISLHTWVQARRAFSP